MAAVAKNLITPRLTCGSEKTQRGRTAICKGAANDKIEGKISLLVNLLLSVKP